MELASGKSRERSGKKAAGYNREDARDHEAQRARKLLQAGLE